jgi:DNA helicase-2/ATP-dependent DNA helicase PcrA
VGLTRARKRAKIYFVSNRRIHGSWSSTAPSRFIDELPAEHVEVKESQGNFGGFSGYGGFGESRFDRAGAFGSSYSTPGWQRAQKRGLRDEFSQEADDDAFTSPGSPAHASRGNTGGGHGSAHAPGRFSSPTRRTPLTIEGELTVKSTGTTSTFKRGDRVFHMKFGNGNVTAVDGNKLTIQFDRAGEKRVVDSFVERV